MLRDKQGMFSYSFTGKQGLYTMISRCPSGYSHELDTVTTETRRSVGPGAYLNGEFLAFKNKFYYEWNYMTDKQYAELAKMKKKRQFFFWIKTVDPETPEEGVKPFNVYCGDLKGTAVRADESDGRIVAWKNVTMNLIER